MDGDVFSYGTQLLDDEIYICVDQDFAKKDLSHTPWLIELCLNIKGLAHELPPEEMYAKFLKKVYSLQEAIKSMEFIHAHLVGYWVRPKKGTICCYVSEEEKELFIQCLESIGTIWKNKVEMKVQFDPQWAMYFDFLLPTKTEEHLVRTSATLQDLYDKTEDLDQMLLLEHRFHLNNEEEMMALMDKLTQYPNEPWRIVTVKHSMMPLPIGEEKTAFIVLVEQETNLTTQTIQETVIAFSDLAQDFSSDYAGWKVVEDQLPKMRLN